MPRDLYPFEHRHLEIDGLRYHYIDEGKGPPVVMLHGNPTWSIHFRNLVKHLRGSHRCIVPDHMGCGFSDKPGDRDYDYHFARRAADLDQLLRHLGIEEKLTLVLHDWGGMIGMVHATRHPESIARLVILNTAAFHLPASKSLPWLLRLARGPLGAPLILGFNLFSRATARLACARVRLPRDVRNAYTAPYDSWRNRIATLRFVEDIPLRPGDRGFDLVSEVEAGLERFRETPALILWGMKDFVFDHVFLERWEQALPRAEVHRFEDCGHYLLEDATQEVLERVSAFLAESRPRAPAPSEAPSA